jgi:hypothetical protein
MGPPAARSRHETLLERLKDNPIRNEEELDSAKRARGYLDNVRYKFRKSDDPEDEQKVEQANAATNLLRQRIAEYETGVAAQTPASSQLKRGGGGFKTVAREAVAKDLEGRPIKDADEYNLVKKYKQAAYQRSRDLIKDLETGKIQQHNMTREEIAAESDRQAAQAEFFKQKLKEFEANPKAKAKAKA